MRTEMNHPSLADLWRVLLSSLERVAGPRDAPILARSLAIAGLIGRPARAFGVAVERRGDDVVVTTPEPVRTPAAHPSRGRHSAPVAPLPVHRRPSLSAR